MIKNDTIFYDTICGNTVYVTVRQVKRDIFG